MITIDRLGSDMNTPRPARVRQGDPLVAVVDHRPATRIGDLTRTVRERHQRLVPSRSISRSGGKSVSSSDGEKSLSEHLGELFGSGGAHIATNFRPASVSVHQPLAYRRRGRRDARPKPRSSSAPSVHADRLWA